MIDGLNVRFQLWDSAGQERYRAVSPLHYKSNLLHIKIQTSWLLYMILLKIQKPIMLLAG